MCINLVWTLNKSRNWCSILLRRIGDVVREVKGKIKRDGDN